MQEPTLKIRVAMPDEHSHLGADCHAMAAKIVDDSFVVLDAKWGRPPDKWVADGQDWGRTALKEWEKGYVQAVRQIAEEHAVIANLLSIIDRLSK